MPPLPIRRPPDADAGASRVVLAIGYRYWLSRIVLAQELN
jgi:hypothetical protein